MIEGVAIFLCFMCFIAGVLSVCVGVSGWVTGGWWLAKLSIMVNGRDE